MEDNLTTQEEGQQPEEQEPIIEFTTREDYVNCAAQAIAAVDGYDPAIMSEVDARRIKRIKRKCLRIIAECVDEMYDELFDEEKNDTP